jgi:hypothetical protein
MTGVQRKLARIDKIIPCRTKMEHISFFKMIGKFFTENCVEFCLLSSIKKALAGKRHAKAHLSKF